MARMARYKSSDEAFYHVTNRVAGDPSFFPFKDPSARRELIRMFWYFARRYFCRLGAVQVMGNHFHLLVFMSQYRDLTREQLEQKAVQFYGRRAQLKTMSWTDEDWKQFNLRLFDLSHLMHSIDGEYAKWYNRTFGRRGHFWADRFKSNLLIDFNAVQECLLYVELNSLRAGLVERPEDWSDGSACWRVEGTDQELLPLQELFPEVEASQAYAYYRARLYARGALATRDKQAVIPEWIFNKEAKTGLLSQGQYTRRQRFFTDGIAIGTQTQVLNLLRWFREQGQYQRRRNPASQLEGQFFTVREQRSNARVLEKPLHPGF